MSSRRPISEPSADDDDGDDDDLRMSDVAMPAGNRICSFER